MLQQLLGGLAGNEDGIDHLLGVVAGSVPIGDFFAPDHVERLLAA